MTAYWNVSDEPVGRVITVEATFEGDAAAGWRGQVTTVPFGGRVVRGADFGLVRERLAGIVLAQVKSGQLPLPANAVNAVRLLSVTAAYYPRGQAEGPAIVVPAVADREAGAWLVATAPAAGALSGQGWAGATITEAQGALAGALMVALEVGIDGLAPEWSGIWLHTLTRKTYPVADLSAG